MTASWDYLADTYDKHNGGRRARTLKMDTVFNWAERQTNLFKLTETGELEILAEGGSQ